MTDAKGGAAPTVEDVALLDKPVSASAGVLATPSSSACAAALLDRGGNLHTAVLAAPIGSQLPMLP